MMSASNVFLFAKLDTVQCRGAKNNPNKSEDGAHRFLQVRENLYLIWNYCVNHVYVYQTAVISFGKSILFVHQTVRHDIIKVNVNIVT